VQLAGVSRRETLHRLAVTLLGPERGEAGRRPQRRLPTLYRRLTE
jgi:hypothetical protein